MNKEFSVRGMHCKSCEAILKDSIGDINGVSDVSASAASGKLKVIFDETKTTENEIKNIIKKEGYAVINK
jgi:Cu2+-exporting ATPase/Cu+-exporting ATPase